MDGIFFVVNVEAAIHKDGKWLLGKRSDQEYNPGTLSLVGGKVENVGIEEDVLEEALKREIKEEVDIEIDNELKYVKSSSFKGANQTVIDVVFLCKYKSGEAAPKDTEEITEVKWMTLAEVLENDAVQSWTKDSLSKASKMI
ncbi:hypothetical protein A3G67_00440 [Candidatus Roizmanbacteria bacterium RIFCSPLOWO2_12_FULL_40_12]|nr:MAG: hypothetical protein A2W49_04415 [Candidatus Roizmanbacteria bacterium RIFCSPHIGHO2_12_41_18]OGK58932.1 MAG: hypothetical protein A3H84_04385 [Candidatus Roizmanbacteria bacterium RIFCSPLOWO2_02_FULL_40_13]OGK61242.1 MAG: hypothetical protein A3G67_00440 [Candidatus Roizmanbacteria bacterium RIFCSPLOWO2_12_FULL_40_12]